MNCTAVVFAETAVSTVTCPETVAPGVGDAMDMLGGVGGAVLLTVTETTALVAVCPAALLATALRVCEPSGKVVVSSENRNGACPTGDPEFFPST